MAPKRVDVRIEKLIVRLHDEDEKWSFEKIAKHIKMTKMGVRKIYQRVKNPKPVRHGGKPRATDKRLDFSALSLLYHNFIELIVES